MAEPERPIRKEGRDRQLRESNAGGNLTEFVTLYDHMDDVDVDPAKLQIEEWMVAEVMRRLEEEINRPCGCGGGVVEASSWLEDHRWQLVQLAPASSSSSSAPVVAAAPAFVTVKGNEESCGPSFSDSASTVMASIDTRGVPRQPIRDEAEEEIWPWFPEPTAPADPPAAVAGVGGGIAGAGGTAAEGFAVEDPYGSDDEWLARVLSGAEFEAEAERFTRILTTAVSSLSALLGHLEGDPTQ